MASQAGAGTRSNEVSRLNGDDTQDSQRRRLLASLFGSDIPPALRGTLLRTSDVAALFQVSERTVCEWARRGRLPSVRTPGGHRRYPVEQIRELLDDVETSGIGPSLVSHDPGPGR